MKYSVLGITAALASFGLASAAAAADLGGSIKDPAPYYAPAVSVFSWTGFYAGLQTGYVWGEANNSFSDPLLVGGGSDPEGWIGGGYGGYNWQSGNFVFGFETDIEAGDVNGSFSSTGGLISGSTDLNWQGSLRGRIGIAADRTLFYLTGGWAYGEADIDGTSLLPAPLAGTGAESVSLSGWTLGGGMEYAVSHNFTVRAEYRYTDFGDVSVDFDNVNLTMPVEVETHALRIGAGWKF
jgi:outer membrane immunogenic protein